jgi:putative transposase
VLKAFQYRIYPTARQERLLNETLAECRWLYNHFLHQRKTAWEERQETIGLYDQLGELPALKGETPGYPRFRGRHRYDSFCFPQAPSGCQLHGNQLHLSKIGVVHVVLHRELEGNPKTVCVRRSPTGKWYVTIACEWEPAALEPSSERVGIDVGLASFATLSTGETILNPCFFRQEEKALAKASRQLAKEEKGTPKRRKRRKVVARVHERTRFRRKDFSHRHSRKIVNRFQVIAVEDLSVNLSQEALRIGGGEQSQFPRTVW